MLKVNKVVYSVLKSEKNTTHEFIEHKPISF